MSRRTNITPEMVAQMEELYAKGKSFLQIANIVGVHKTACYYWLNEKKKRVAKRKELARLPPLPKQAPVLPWQEPPEDTRTLSARIMGDPLPGRSALDKMRAEEAATKETTSALDTSLASDPVRTPAAIEDAEGRSDGPEGEHPVCRPASTYNRKAAWPYY